MSSSNALSTHFSRVVNTTSVASWNAVIADLARSGNPVEALLAFSSLRRRSLAPNHTTFPCALKSAATLPSLAAGRQIHLLALLLGATPDLFVASSLVDMYSKCGRPHEARQVFDESSHRNAVLYTALVTGYISNSSPHEAVSLFKRFLADLGSTELDPGAMVSLLTASARVSAPKRLVGGAHGVVVKVGLEGDTGVANTLMDAYARGGQVAVSRKVFDGMRERDVVSWNSMVAVYAQNGLAAEALKLYSEMMRGGAVWHNAVTLSAVLLACAHAGALQVGKCVHDQVIIGSEF